ncbi:fluoride efflux transporter CrcB [Porphyrobacter sp. GA68]|uniref:fluoride efflux transporter CrcB n=1 Tax=Porphyrobacter sp. GA68 TaxID=2883480 RepID=UPI001D18E88A|nr:fluoride efflux transporter CrcB [Porphyrobacter sp. GA68]
MPVPLTFLAVVQVAAGGAMGAVLRWLLGATVLRWYGPALTGVPVPTLLVNVVGSLLMGVLSGWLMKQAGDEQFWRLCIGVGLLGGFTTFSTFSLELWLLIEKGLIGLALAYAFASLGGGLLALWAGIWLARGMA